MNEMDESLVSILEREAGLQTGSENPPPGLGDPGPKHRSVCSERRLSGHGLSQPCSWRGHPRSVVTRKVLGEKNPSNSSSLFMKPTSISQPIVKMSPDIGAVPGLKIVGIYQDNEGRTRIGDLRDRVAKLAGPDAVPISAWSLDELSHAPAFQEAVSAAALADVLVVSIHAGEQISPALCAWVVAWLPRRQRREGALIALLGVAAGQSDVPLAWTKEYLSTIARRSGLEFLLLENLMSAKDDLLVLVINSIRENTA